MYGLQGLVVVEEGVAVQGHSEEVAGHPVK